MSEPGDPTTLLVDANQEWNTVTGAASYLLQIPDEADQLLRVDNVPREQHDPADAVVADELPHLGSRIDAIEADHHSLAGEPHRLAHGGLGSTREALAHGLAHALPVGRPPHRFQARQGALDDPPHVLRAGRFHFLNRT